MERRVAAAPETPRSRALTDVLATIGRLTEDLRAAPEPAAVPPLPTWLREALLHVVRLSRVEVDALTRTEADQVWLDYTTGRGR